MRDPEDDVRLAKHLVDEVLGATVAWPSDKEVEDYVSGKAQIDLASELEKIMSCAEEKHEEYNGDENEDEAEDEDDEELELDWWESGYFFGVRNFSHELAPLCASVDEDAPAIHALCDQNISEVAKGSKEVGVAEEKAPKDKKKKFANISEEKQKMYDEYTEEKLDRERIPVSLAAKAFMRELVQKWQAENGTGEFKTPYLNEWYYDARVEAIKAGHVSKRHCEDVVRSYVWKFYHKKAQASKNAD
jgi:hypothetical protein